jgi:Na+-transporting NADH:ubiquinone oxidoreductase subunit C
MPAERTSPETPLATLRVAVFVSLVCATLVSVTALLLRPRQEANRAAERRQHMAALVAQLPGIEELLSTDAPPEIEAQVIELSTGTPVESIDAATYDPRQAALDPQRSIELSAEEDIAGIQRRARYATVYLLRHGGRLQLIILPVYGSGYDSRLYGYLALAGDANTVVALSFYEHEETPGLGAEIDSDAWRTQWKGRRVRDADGTLRLGVAKGRVAPDSANAAFEVDGITGATVTSQGVHALLRFWLGDTGYGPYLARVQEGEGA